MQDEDLQTQILDNYEKQVNDLGPHSRNSKNYNTNFNSIDEQTAKSFKRPESAISNELNLRKKKQPARP